MKEYIFKSFLWRQVYSFSQAYYLLPEAVSWRGGLEKWFWHRAFMCLGFSGSCVGMSFLQLFTLAYMVQRVQVSLVMWGCRPLGQAFMWPRKKVRGGKCLWRSVATLLFFNSSVHHVPYFKWHDTNIILILTLIEWSGIGDKRPICC